MSHVLELLRAANVALLTVAVLALVLWLSDAWSSLSRGRRITMVSIRVLLLGGIAGSAIKFLTHAPVDASILIVTIGSLGVIVGQFMARKEDAHFIPARAILAVIDAADTDGITPCDHPGCMSARAELRRLATSVKR